MRIIDLNGKWEACGTAPNGEKVNICGNVPGSALNDIVNSEISEEKDIFYRDNAEKFQKYELYNWVYTKKFIIDESLKNAELVFEKLDTYCDIYLNDKHIAYCDNAYIPHSFDVEDALVIGENTIEVYFYSSIMKIDGKKERYAGFSAPRLYCRRPQYSFGWDWAMRFVSCGISGDVCIRERNDGIKIESVYVYTKSIDGECAEIGIEVNFKDFEKGSLINLRIEDPLREIIRTRSIWCSEEMLREILYIRNPKLWFPIGYGEHPLYKLYIECNGTENCTEFGIRTVRLLQLPDEKEGEYYNKCRHLL
ncbi:MAG: hypothetical protein E7415_02030 [Ruminococcaceae bacterium]|nr:hypothetical protein [Oscillospiraceae bacterium]